MFRQMNDSIACAENINLQYPIVKIKKMDVELNTTRLIQQTNYYFI